MATTEAALMTRGVSQLYLSLGDPAADGAVPRALLGTLIVTAASVCPAAIVTEPDGKMPPKSAASKKTFPLAVPVGTTTA